MGIFSSKIIAGILAGTVVVGGSAYAFTGGDALDKAKGFIGEATQSLVQYEANENQLIETASKLQQEATEKINQANDNIIALKGQVGTLTTERDGLQVTVAGLQTNVNTLEERIRGLKASLATEQGKNTELTQQLADLQTEYDAKVLELEEAQTKLAETEATLVTAQADLVTANNDLATATADLEAANATIAEKDSQLTEADKQVADLEAELEKANAEVTKANEEAEEVGQAVDDAKAIIGDAKPAAALPGANDITLPDVVSISAE